MCVVSPFTLCTQTSVQPRTPTHSLDSESRWRGHSRKCD